jgi:hypothetical protein
MAARGSASAENYFKKDFSWVSWPPSGYPPGIMEKAKVPSGYTGIFLLVWYIV